MLIGLSGLASYKGHPTGKILVALQCALSEKYMHVTAYDTATLKKLLSYKSFIVSYKYLFTGYKV